MTSLLRQYDAPPAWWDLVEDSFVSESHFKAPDGAYILIKIRKDEMDHDGYCSEADNDHIYVAKKYIFVAALPAGDYDFSKKTWKGGVSCSGGCGCCGARDVYTLLSTEAK
jgi:hypothetical protein